MDDSSKVGHTPGEWFAKRDGWSTVYVEARIGGGMLQEVAARGPTEAGQEQQEANARLIAAAPDLLAALQSSLDVIEAEFGIDSMHCVGPRAAIAKALGSAA